MSTSIKVFFSREGAPDDVRRFKLEPPLTHAALTARVQSLFAIVPTLKWKDEDGDLITIGNDADLLEAARSCPGTLKVYATASAIESASTAQGDSGSDGWERVEAMTLAEEPVVQPSEPEQEQAAEPNEEQPAQPEQPAIEQQTADEQTTEAPTTESPEPEPAAAESSPEQRCLVHSRVQCDVTGMFPIVGPRWHKIGEDYDLCATAFEALPESEREQFELIPFEGAQPVPYTKSTEAEPEAMAAEAPAVHIGVTCDLSGMCPIVGNRWHLIGHNYDVCEAEFRKLPVEKQERFELIAQPGDRPQPFGYPKRFTREGDAAEQAAALLKTVLTALQDNYSVEIDLVPRGQEGQHQRGPVRAEMPIRVDAVNGESHVEAGVPAMPEAKPEPKRRHGGHGHGGHGHRGHGHRHHGHGHWHAHGRGGRWHRHGKTPIAPGDILPTETMTTGSFGPGVAQLQNFLVDNGLMTPDAIAWRQGFFGPRTTAAVRSFQAANRIGDRSTWGVVDAATRESLLKLHAPATEAPAPEVVATHVSAPEAVVSEARVVEPTAPAVPVAEAEPVLTQPAPPVEQSKWREQLITLASMGFVDHELLVPILDRTNGHVDAVIAALLD